MKRSEIRGPRPKTPPPRRARCETRFRCPGSRNPPHIEFKPPARPVFSSPANFRPVCRELPSTGAQWKQLRTNKEVQCGKQPSACGKAPSPRLQPGFPHRQKKDRVFCCEAVEPYLTNLESIASGRRLHRITNTRNLRNRGAALNMLKINDFRMPPSREHKNCFSVGMWRSSVWLTKRGSLLLAL